LRNAHRVAAAAIGLLGAAVDPAPAADAKTVSFVLRLEDQANEIWATLPTDPGDSRVTLVADTSRSCAADALRRGRDLLAQGEAGRVALRDLSLTLPLPQDLANELGRGTRSSELLAPHLTAGLRSDHVLQPIADAACEDAGAFYDLRGAKEGPGLRLHLLLEAGCGDARVRIAGESELDPGVAEGKRTLRMRARPARYAVLASCETRTAQEAKKETSPVRPAKLDPCGAPCAPLAKGLLAWQKQATDMTAKLADLAGKATAVQLEISTDSRELDAAQAAKRKPRAVLERISALQAKIKAAEAELARVTRVSQEVQRYLVAVQGAADDTRLAGERCQSQCQARQQQRTDRAPDKNAGSGGTTATATGGGLSTGVILVGGAALAAGGVAVATLGGGDDPAADTPAGIPGTWMGTRTTTAQVLPPLRCTRVFDETWVITQNGSQLRADITVLPQGCGAAPGCPQGCQVFSFNRFHPGTAEGDTARFFVFPELQVPSCVLPLRLSGNTLSGTMPACDTGNVDTLSDVVSLRRSGR
jgi:hypothetical protein